MATDPVIRLRRLALMAAVEATAGTFALPAAADALEVADATITPTEGEEVEYNIVRPHFGANESVLVTRFRKMAFKVGLAGVGVAGALPGYAKLLRGCGLAATNTPAPDPDPHTLFAPIGDAFESLSLYAVIDKNVYKMPGAAGNVKLEGGAKQLPWFNFEFTGAWKAVEVLGAMPATTPVFELPLGVNAANTRVKLGAKYWPCNAFSIDLGNVVTKQDLTEVDNTEITGRASSGSITIRNTLATTHDWDALIGTKLAFELLHGQGATNTLTVAAPRAQIGKPSFGEQDGLQMVTLPLKFIPSATGNDELTIRV